MTTPVILFDGVCNLCNSAVTFVIRHDKQARFKFAALQSDTGAQLLKEHRLATDSFKSFVLIEDGVAYTESSAALRVCRYLSGLWPMMYGFIIVPPFIRNGVYKLIAANRYRWFGRQEQCMLPTPALKARFLEST